MVPRPPIFISAVTRELKSARQLVANTLHFLGYEPVWQDVFGTEQGDLRAMLREKIDPCHGIVQLVGHRYGAEPPTADERFGRCSYTQYEALYARARGKKVWYLLLDEQFPRDPADAEPQELSELQHAYRRRLQCESQLYHPLSSKDALESSVLKLRDDLAKLRHGVKRWAIAVSVALVLILLISTWLLLKQRSASEELAGQSKTLTGLDTRGEIDSARQQLAAAIAAADLRDAGQIQALERLLGGGESYAGVELKGLKLRGAKLAGFDFTKTSFCDGELSNADLSKSKLGNADLMFARLRETNLAGAVLARAALCLADAEAADFRGADAQRASFFGARLRGANFAGADLRGANLALCDLRDADLRDANLEDAFLISAVLDGARLEGAHFANTDVTGARGVVASEAQRSGMCRSESDGGVIDLFFIVEVIPSSRFDGGYEYRPIMDKQFFLPELSAPSDLPLAKAHTFTPVRWPVLEGKDGSAPLITADFREQFAHEFLKIADRRARILARAEELMTFLKDRFPAPQGTRHD